MKTVGQTCFSDFLLFLQDASPRGHVLAEIVETEKSYVDSLRILVKVAKLACSPTLCTCGQVAFVSISLIPPS